MIKGFNSFYRQEVIISLWGEGNFSVYDELIFISKYVNKGTRLIGMYVIIIAIII